MKREGQPESAVDIPYRHLAAAVLVSAWEDATHRCTSRCLVPRVDKGGKRRPVAHDHALRSRQARRFLLGMGMFAESLRLWTQVLDVHPDFLRVQLERAQNGRRPGLALAVAGIENGDDD